MVCSVVDPTSKEHTVVPEVNDSGRGLRDRDEAT